MDLYQQAYVKMQERLCPIMFARSPRLINQSLYLMNCSNYHKVKAIEIQHYTIPNHLSDDRLLVEHLLHHKIALSSDTKSWEIKYKADKYAAQHIRKYAPQVLSNPVLFQQLQKFLVKLMNISCKEIGITTFHVPSTSWSVSGWINKQDDQNFARKLINLGAEPIKNVMALPDYKSWAQIKPGEKLALRLEDGTTISYLPHYPTFLQPDNAISPKFALTSDMSEKPRTQFSCQLTQTQKTELLDIVHNKAKNNISEFNLNTVKIFNEDIENNSQYAKTLLLVKYGKKEHIVYLKISELAQKMTKEGFFPKKSYQYLKELIWERVQEKKHEKVCFEGQQISGWFKAVREQDIPHIPLGQGMALVPNNLALNQSQSIIMLSQIIQDLSPFICLIEGSILSNTTLIKRRIRQRFNFTFSSDKNIGELRDIVVDKIFDWGEVAETSQQILHPTAPLSERGHLQISPAPRNFAQYQKISYILGLEERIVQPKIGFQYTKRTATKQQLEDIFPEDKMIIHGITGVNTFGQAYSRLRTIIMNGGLYSSSERRRMGFSGRTLSPLGDSASGIDWAVPATINAVPSYGSKIFFVLHNRLLLKEDIFFAPYDFGSGEDRWRKYQAHALLLGQPAIYQPCPWLAIQSQLVQLHKKSVKQISTNEICFGRGVALNDIAAIVYESGVSKDSLRQNKIEALVKWAQKKNLLQNHIEVIEYSANKKAAFQNARKYTWT